MPRIGEVLQKQTDGLKAMIEASGFNPHQDFWYIKKSGRIAKYTDPEQVAELCEQYFDEQEERKKPKTVAGLAAFLGIDRKRLMQYAFSPLFAPAMKHAMQRLNAEIEEHLLVGKNQVGAIFYSKNNFGYVDKREVETTHRTIADVLDTKQQEIDNVIEGEVIEEDTDFRALLS